MSGKISVIGDVPVAATVASGARGARVLVAPAGADVSAAARLAPAAVLLLVDAGPEDVARALAATLWPSQRVVGVAGADVERAVSALAQGGEVELRATLRGGEADVVLSPGGARRA